jgi:hypothetical protein
MAPTGLMTSWQILLEIRAASSKSDGCTRWFIESPFFQTWHRRLCGFSLRDSATRAYRGRLRIYHQL